MSDPLVLEKIQALSDRIGLLDRLYTERDDARGRAVDASFAASEKAIVKAEDAQKAYNLSHNDLARKMDEQNKATMPRTETEARFQALEEKINEQRGRSAGGQVTWGYVVGGIGVLIGLATLALKLGG